MTDCTFYRLGKCFGWNYPLGCSWVQSGPSTQRPTVPVGPLGVQRTHMLTGERWRGWEKQGRTAGGVAVASLLILYFVLEPLENSCLNKYTVLWASPPFFFCFLFFLYHPSILKPYRACPNYRFFFLKFFILLFAFQNKRLIEWCAKCGCVFLYLPSKP